MTIPKAQLLDVYAVAALGKELDDRVQQLLMAGTIATTWFSWRGSELIGAVVGTVMRPEDQLVAYYRDGMSQFAKGSSVQRLFAEALGKATGTQKGKSGWVHSVDLDANVVMNSGVVGGQLPIAAGWGLASVLRGDDKVTVCTFGDGAANEGAFHEALTLASLWKLPVVYVCHNNRYAEHTAFDKTSPVAHVADRAAAYDVPAVTVDGGDVPTLWDAMGTAIERARTGGGPSLVEATTYRFRGHTRYDPMRYIPAGEVDEQVRADPLPLFRSWLVEQGRATEAELAALDARARTEVEQAWEFARDSPFPDAEELLADVYAS
ncbi:thiamine pyrophosphate-dependent dehydrogenase E1 component subunit alpha [Pseudonocardia sp. GCM10023141]|uniref:thiamine pyrophosphate-dependent dehydrogenase E1 component subunit alpha n=1 Tax=Pseudonocardia sp. GCM10023141 TaxID=3252653 RepID=UPI003613BDF0